MSALPPVAPGRTIVTRGFDRVRYGAVLIAAAVAVGLFVLWSLNLGHGIYALIVLILGAIALTWFGGPEHLARTITVSDATILITRFHRVSTSVDRAELLGARSEVVQDAKGRSRVVLMLTPHDPVEFFTRHRELRAVRQDDAAYVPAGISSQTAHELTQAL